MALPRICECPDCFEWFQPKHDGAKCCSVKCKNRKNYINNSLEYSWEDSQIGQRRKNLKILEYLYHKGNRLVTRELIEAMGFSFAVAFAPVSDENDHHYFRFGNSLLKIITETNFEILYHND